MTKLEQARKAVIMALHPECESYEDTFYEEFKAYGIPCTGNIDEKILMPITIGRIMKAFQNIRYKIDREDGTDAGARTQNDIDLWIKDIEYNWKFANDQAKELTLEDQSEETLDEIIKLFTNN